MTDRFSIDVFISHHTSTCLKITQAICNSLENSGIRCWYAPRDVTGTYAGDIIEAINSCKVFVVVLNQESSLSKHVLNEINAAVECDVAIVPFQISNEMIGKDAQYYIRRWHWVDAVTPPMEDRINELKVIIQKLLGQKAGGSLSAFGFFKDQHAAGLKSTNVLLNNNFVCRNNELNEMHESLMEYNKLFVQGMGGLGKSELVKAYVAKYKREYHTVIFATYQTTLKDLLIYDTCFQIEGISRACDQEGKLESDDSFCLRKLSKLQELLDEKTLLIIDNFDTTEDELLEQFLKGFYTVIFTSRNDFSDFGLPVLALKEMEETEQMELFLHYYKRPVAEEKQEVIRQIMRMVNGHTLAIELIAKFMMMRRIQPEKMLLILQEKGIRSLDMGTVSHGFAKAQTIYANIQSLFNAYQLSEEEQAVLSNLSFMPLTGVEFEVFMELCEMDDAYAIDSLIKKSWVRYDFADDKISLHPLIRDVVCDECKVTMQKCAVMIQNLTQKLKQLWGMQLTEKLIYTSIGKTVYEKFPEFNIEFAETYMWIGFSLSLQEQFETAIDIFESCLKGYRNAYGEMSAQVAEVYYKLGDTEGFRHNSEASIEYLKKSIEILDVVMPDSERLAYMIKYLCWILLGCSNDYLTIEKYLNKSNQILLSQNPPNMSQIASQNSAYAYLYYFLGQYEKALGFAEEAYKVFDSMHGEVHGDTLAPMGIKSRILSKIGRAQDAIDLCLKVIHIQKQLNGEVHNKVLSRCEHLAEIYENIGEYEKAKETLCDIVTILEKKHDTTSAFYKRIVLKIKQIRGERL